ncbi:MAG: N-acetyl sugar amidotransferase [Bacteroidetes bacterium]|nr:N-acetyl sugar amidotransferase [Bacteroidota bacterium]MBK9671984.1 N-acetyl sugar amidotransferase [Bacteroidota bacterium]MBK9800403.1 N-acetyl sugar amidotransferase [Bacteroidota bacterium]
MSDKKYKIAPDRPAKMRYCKQCVYPASSAVPLAFGDDGICSGCRSASQRVDIDWDRRKKMFERLIEDYRCKDGSNYDCIIPVSGGKDSYFQIHIIKKVYGLNPLLVTYHGNNYTPTGMKNLLNMREAFDADHVFFTPSIDVLKAMNRLGMQVMGDMNWHAHAGIFTYPIRVAVQQNVPLMIWGEHGFMDLGGMHSYNDLVEFTYRYRHEHCMRGYEWYDILEKAESYGEKLEKKQLIPWMYPSDEEIERVGVRGIYISNFFKWEANEHGKLMQEKYGFLPAEEPFERTYRTTSNLDDMHENGIHDYMKYIKFGYGRATDHVCKDIRAGILNRDTAIEIVRKMDPIKSKDLQRWLTYVDWTEEKFDAVADSFRDPRVWWKTEDGRWQKDNLWDEK